MKTNLKKHPELIPTFVKGLRDQLVAVNFTKKDGSLRDMKCTRCPAHIPDDKYPKGSDAKSIVVEEPDEDPTFVRVFDVEAQAWRSIIFDAVNSFGPA